MTQKIEITKITLFGNDLDIFSKSDLLREAHIFPTYWKGKVSDEDQAKAIAVANTYKEESEAWNYDDYVTIFIETLEVLGYEQVELAHTGSWDMD